ncbi:MAG: phage major capsid protein [Sandarakinorhabdus sp.]|nr:phage major capsid protein [Sandarakinorhabdus sp.]
MLTRELIERRTALLAEIDAIPLDQSDEFDRKTAELRALEARIRFAEERIRFAEERDAADRRAPGTPVAAASAAVECRAFAGVRSPVPAEFRGSLWRARDGMAIPVLAPEDRMVSFAPADESGANDLGLSGFMRAMVYGPQSDLELRVLGGAAIGTGGAFVPSPLAASMIDLMRANTVAIRAGAMTVPMTSATLAIARQTADPTAAWRAENAAIAESDPVFDRVNMSAKSLAVRFNVSRELLEDGQNTDAACRNILAQALAAALDRAVLIGAGTATEPLGIRGTAGIQSVSMGVNGLALTGWGPVLDAVRQLELANAGTVSAMLMSPRTARQINGFADTTGQWLQAPPRVASVPSYSTTSLPLNEVQGTSTDCSSIFLGDFSEVLIGMRTELQISVLQERFAELGQIGFIAWLRADVALARPAAIARILGIRP